MGAICGSRDGLLVRCRVANKEPKISLSVVETATTTFTPPGQTIFFNLGRDQQAWQIIAYEVWMYFGTRSKMKAPAIDDEVLKNATVESAIVHARILCDIFRSRATRQGGGILLTALSKEWKDSHLNLTKTSSRKSEISEKHTAIRTQTDLHVRCSIREPYTLTKPDFQPSKATTTLISSRC